jgi:2-polyprenyl-3-methyl-5-hydroxy-6-metoxy-1,4-benzoquinol methylase
MQWKQCRDCLHIFTDGYYTDEACNIIFGKTNESQKVGGKIEANRFVSSKMVEKVLPYASDGIWLDVGFGNGALLFTAQEYGFTPVGLDLRSENVNIMNSLGIEAHCKNIEDVSLPETCAVISMADVLEHVPYPKTVLSAARKLLKDGGVLLISMPNTENILWKILSDQNANPYWGELEHYHNFSRTRLYALLNEHGFNPVRYGISERYRVCMEVIAIQRPLISQ